MIQHIIPYDLFDVIRKIVVEKDEIIIFKFILSYLKNPLWNNAEISLKK